MTEQVSIYHSSSASSIGSDNSNSPITITSSTSDQFLNISGSNSNSSSPSNTGIKFNIPVLIKTSSSSSLSSSPSKERVKDREKEREKDKEKEGKDLSNQSKKKKKEKKSKSSSESKTKERYLMRAIYNAQIGFDYEDEIPVAYRKLLDEAMRLTGSEFGYIGGVTEVTPSFSRQSSGDASIADMRISGSIKVSQTIATSYPSQTHNQNVVIHSIIDPSETLYVRQQDIYSNTVAMLTDPKNIFGSILVNKRVVVTARDDEAMSLNSGTASEKSDELSQFVLPELRSLGRPSLYNFAGIPVLKKKSKENTDITLLGVIGLGNRKGGFSNDYIETIRPYIHTCETLLQAFHNYRTVHNNIHERDQLMCLIKSAKDPETGFVVKDRKYHLKTYRRTFIGREATSWLLANAEHMGVKTREDAVKVGKKLMSETKAFHHVLKEHDFEDDYLFYTFHDDAVIDEENPKSALSPALNRHSRSASFIIPTFRSRENSKDSLNEKSSSSSSNDKKFKLHAIVAKRDAHTLKKKLTQRKVIEQLNLLNQDQQTALHIAIEINDYECVELLLKAYRQNIDKIDIHTKDRNGYTPLHTASELGNEKIIITLLLHPGIQTNIGNNYYNTPFHCFCNKFSTPSSISQIFDLWIQRGTLINVQNKGGETPLHKAILNPTMRAIVARRLVEYGADVNITNSRGETPLHYAIHLKRKDLVYILLCGGADPDIKGKEELVNSELEENQEIQTLLAKTRDLRTWLESIYMKNYLPVFMKHLIFKDVLHNVNEKTLIDMEITLAGDRLRILQAIDAYKDEAKNKIYGSPMDRNGSELIPKGKVRLADLRRRTPAFLTEKTIIPPKQSSSQEKIFRQIEQVEVNWIKYSDLEFTEFLGSGTSGAVYRGFYRGEQVAIKVLEKDKDNKTEEFGHEFKIMSAIRGENIVHFYGACADPKPCLVMEYCSRGNLYEILCDSKVQFGWKEVLRFSTEMAEAIQVLHTNTPQVLHRDLKSMNFLVTKEWTIKVCDFGLSRFSTGTNMNTFYQLRGTMAYCAPETFEGKQFTVASDVYSIGIILWEMLYKCVTGEYQRPYAEFTYITQPFQIIIQAAQKGLRPTIPIADKCPQSFVNLINSCWDSVPEKRPNTGEILKLLEKCKEDFESHPAEWNSSVLNISRVSNGAYYTISIGSYR